MTMPLPTPPFDRVERRFGIFYSLLAYSMWGLMPLYLHLLIGVPLLEVLCHRIVWSFLLLVLVMALQGDFSWVAALRERPRVVWTFFTSACLLSVNWFVYIWAVGAGRVVDASFGYFVNPLISVLLAVIVLKEKLRRGQWAAVSLAGLGVLWLFVALGQLPWIGLVLAASFGLYGLLRKRVVLDSIAGLTLETTVLLPAAAGYLLWLALSGNNSWSSNSATINWLLVAAGPITAGSLVSFAAGLRRIPLSLLGIIQYLGPSLQLLVGVWVFREPFPLPKLIGFALIWLSVLSYTVEGLYFTHKSNQRA
jgi:chloramphenicol-sensitive protein RarD